MANIVVQLTNNGDSYNHATNAEDAADEGYVRIDAIYGLGGNDTILGDSDISNASTNATQHGYYAENHTPVLDMLPHNNPDDIRDTSWAGYRFTNVRNAYSGLIFFDEYISGGDGNNTAFGFGGNDWLLGGNGNDALWGGDGDDALDGGSGNDSLYTGSGLDYVNGGIGDDTVHAYEIDNGDYLDGGDGNDLLIMTNLNAADFIFELDAVGDPNDHTGYSNRTLTVKNFEKLWFDGSAGFDKVFGGTLDDIINGNGGFDFLRGGGGVDRINGGDGNDSIFGDDGNDILYGGLGEDELSGDNGNDSIYGEDGADRLFGGSGNDRIEGGSGDDIIRDGDGNDTVYGGDGADQIRTGLNSDTIYGGNGNDAIGEEVADAPGRGDTIYGDGGDDAIYAGGGNDSVDGGLGADMIHGGDGDDTLTGGLGTGDGADQIYGDAGSDTISGGAGNDVLNGGTGAGIDSLTGGIGSDTFLFLSRDDSRTANGNVQDFVQDFARGQDKLDFDAFNMLAADVIISNLTTNGVNYSIVGADQNGNDIIDNGEFAVSVRISGAGFIALSDIIL